MTRLEALQLIIESVKDWAEQKFFKQEDVDSELSSTSTNPIQNKVVNNEINSLKQIIDSLDPDVDISSITELKDRVDAIEETAIQSISGTDGIHVIEDDRDKTKLTLGIDDDKFVERGMLNDYLKKDGDSLSFVDTVTSDDADSTILSAGGFLLFHDDRWGNKRVSLGSHGDLLIDAENDVIVSTIDGSFLYKGNEVVTTNITDALSSRIDNLSDIGINREIVGSLSEITEPNNSTIF